MPQTALQLDVRDLYDPEDNIGGGPNISVNYWIDSEGISLSRSRPTMPENASSTSIVPFRRSIKHAQYVRKVLRYYRTFLARDLDSTGHVIPSSEYAMAPASPEGSIPPAQ
ncbi:MAG: hypothetical protein U0236_04775 [Nitrospira sp.]